MSSSLAIGAVTAVLRRLIETSVVEHDFANILNLSSQPTVSTLPPDRISANQSVASRINLFLFQATENPSLRNQDFPSRNGGGERIANPRLALDLCYLVTAYGSAELHAEILLGHAMFVLHESPVLSRPSIRAALEGLVADSPGDLSDALAASRLADQFEQIKIVPRTMNVEEVSKIWTALQSQYRPSAAYQVSAVLIEATQPARSPLPVLTRGDWIPALNRDSGVLAQAGLQSPVPTLTEVVYADDAPAARLGDVITLRGESLAGIVVRARFREMRGDAVFELAASAGGSADEFSVQLPVDPAPPATPADSPENPANWRAGVYEVSALVTVGARAYETGRLALVLAPRVDSIVTNPPAAPLTSIVVRCSPPVRPTQDVVLLMRDQELRPIASTVAQTTLTFPADATAFPSGDYPARLRVDGVESLLVDRVSRPPRFAPSQVLTIS